MNTETSPGEARTRARKRREIITYTASGLLGGVLGYLIAFGNKGEGDLFRGDWDKIVLDPTIAVVLAIALILGLIVMPVWAFSVSDELVRQRNYIGYTGGGMAMMGGVPAWAMLHAGGLAPAPTASGAWAIGFFATLFVFAIAWLRSR